MPKATKRISGFTSPQPRFEPGSFYRETGIVADTSGKLWRIDPEQGTVKPVTIEDDHVAD